VTNAKDGKLVEITKAEAIALLGGGLSYTQIQPEVALKKDETKTGEFTAKDAGTVVFRSGGTGDAELFVKRGDGASKDSFDCKSTRSGSSEECKLDVAAGEKLTWALLGFGEESKVSLSVGTPIANPEYELNPAAKRFFHVVLALDWIREARPARESHVDDVASYTSTDTMEYILETDDEGRIEGGEYVGSSRTSHPDFIWWPTARPSGRVGGTGLLYEDIRQLNEESAKQDAPPPPVAPTKLFDGVTLAQGESKVAEIAVPAGKKLALASTGAGNVDLYVEWGKAPSVEANACKSEGPAADETCELAAPASGATAFVMVVGKTEGNVTVTASIEP
jgi:hypothetical protein